MGEATAGDPSRRPGLASFDVAGGAPGSLRSPRGAAGQATANYRQHESLTRPDIRAAPVPAATVRARRGRRSSRGPRARLEVLGWFSCRARRAPACSGWRSFRSRRSQPASEHGRGGGDVSRPARSRFLVGGVSGFVVERRSPARSGLRLGALLTRRRWNPATAVLIATVTAGIPGARALPPWERRSRQVFETPGLRHRWRSCGTTCRAGLKLVGSDSLASSGDQDASGWVIDHWG